MGFMTVIILEFSFRETNSPATREIKAIAPPEKTGDMLANYYFIIYTGVGLPVILLGLLDKIIGLLQGIIFYGLAFIAFSMVMGFLLIWEDFKG